VGKAILLLILQLTQGRRSGNPLLNHSPYRFNPSLTTYTDRRSWSGNSSQPGVHRRRADPIGPDDHIPFDEAAIMNEKRCSARQGTW